MIDQIISLLAFFLIYRSKKQYNQAAKLLGKLTNNGTINVSQAIKFLKQSKQKQIQVIVKGILKVKITGKDNEKHILSIIDIKDLKNQLSFQSIFQKINWEDIINKAFYRRPLNINSLIFDIKDLSSQEVIQVKNCISSNISGAISEVVRHRHFPGKRDNFVTFILKNIANLFIVFPLNFIIKKFKFAEQISYYAILDGQYSVIVGNLSLQKVGESLKAVIKNPSFVTKQKGYIQAKLLNRLKKLKYWLFVLISIEILLGYKFIKWAWKKYQTKRNQNLAWDQQQRNQEEGQNCNCIICFTNVRNIIFKPCRHYAVCNECYKSLRHSQCPICKEKIDGEIRVIKR